MYTGAEGYINQYPTPDQLWAATFSEDNQWRDSLSETLRERFAAIPFEDKSGTWEARYYQHNAIKHVLEALCQGQDRILLTMATGTITTLEMQSLSWAALATSEAYLSDFRNICIPRKEQSDRNTPATAKLTAQWVYCPSTSLRSNGLWTRGHTIVQLAPQ